MAKKKNRTAAVQVAQQGTGMPPSAAESSTPANQSPATITGHVEKPANDHHRRQSLPELFSTPMLARDQTKKPEIDLGAESGDKPKKKCEKRNKKRKKAAENKDVEVIKQEEQEHDKKQPKFDVVAAWDAYFGEGTTADWARFCVDLGLEGDFSSKKKCKKAMKDVWVNIYDFLRAKDKEKVRRFPNEPALAAYTIGLRKVYPRKEIEKDSPLKLMLAHILYPRWWMGRKRKAKKVVGTELVKV